MQGDYSRAKQFIDKALIFRPGYVNALIHRAEIRTGLGDTAGALKDLGQTAELSTTDSSYSSPTGAAVIA